MRFGVPQQRTGSDQVTRIDGMDEEKSEDSSDEAEESLHGASISEVAVRVFRKPRSAGVPAWGVANQRNFTANRVSGVSVTAESCWCGITVTGLEGAGKVTALLGQGGNCSDQRASHFVAVHRRVLYFGKFGCDTQYCQ